MLLESHSKPSYRIALMLNPCCHCRSWACQWTHPSRTLPGFKQVQHTSPAFSRNFPAILQPRSAMFCAASAALLWGWGHQVQPCVLFALDHPPGAQSWCVLYVR